jgi:hypothetical protein
MPNYLTIVQIALKIESINNHIKQLTLDKHKSSLPKQHTPYYHFCQFYRPIFIRHAIIHNDGFYLLSTSKQFTFIQRKLHAIWKILPTQQRIAFIYYNNIN